MGGRHTLRLALDRPDLVERLVLIGASPGLAEAGRARAAACRRREVWPRGSKRSVSRPFVDEWLAQPIFAGLPAESPVPRPNDRRTPSRVSRPACGWRARARRSRCGTGWPSSRSPTLLVVGAEDHKFWGVASQMRKWIGANAQLVEIPGAGHAPQLEQPAATATAITRLVARRGVRVRNRRTGRRRTAGRTPTARGRSRRVPGSRRGPSSPRARVAPAVAPAGS